MEEIEKLERVSKRIVADADDDGENDAMEVAAATHDVSSSDDDVDDDDACKQNHGNISIDSQNFLNL